MADGVLRQSTAMTIVLGPFVDDTDGKTAETGLTIAAADVLLSKNGGTFAAANAAAAHMTNGYYSDVLSTGNTDTVGLLTVIVSEAGALPVRHDFQIVEEAIYDSLYAASAGALATAAALATVDDFLDTEVAAIKAKTDNLPAAPAATGDIPTAAVVADAVWDEALAGHAGAGSAGEALDAAGTAGDPWTTALPGAYSAGQAGKIIGDNLNATVSSRASQTSLDTVDNFIDTEIAALTTNLATANTNITTIDDLLDTEIAAIKADTVAILLDTGTDGVVVASGSKTGYALSAAGVDSILDEALTEPAATFTWAGATLRTVVAWLGALSRNKLTQTSTTSTLRNDADSANLSTSTVSDDGTTFVKGEWS